MECVRMWEQQYGFPDGGSFSANQLKKIRKRLNEDWKLEKKKQKIKYNILVKKKKKRIA